MKSFWVRGHLGCLMCWVQRSMGTWDYAPSAHELGSLAWARFLCSAILQVGGRPAGSRSQRTGRRTGGDLH